MDRAHRRIELLCGLALGALFLVSRLYDLAVAGSQGADETPLIVLTAYFIREPRVRFEKLPVTDAERLRRWLDGHAPAYLALGDRGPQAPPLPAFVSERTRSSRRFRKPGGEPALTVREIAPGVAAPAGLPGG